MSRAWIPLAAACLTTAIGCNLEDLRIGRTEHGPRGLRVAAPGVNTWDVSWRGWDAIEQNNGLMTLRHVPGAGGRTLSLEIGGDDAFAVFPENEGKTWPVDGREASVHFGGHYTAIGPERIWTVHDQPFNPHGGPYEVEYDTDNADRHTVRLTSRPGTWKGATIDIDRSITVHRGTTHVIIDETVTNRGPDPLTFYIWDFTQLDALDRRAAGRRLRPLSVYMPVPVEDGRKMYHSFLPPDPLMNEQFDESLPADVLAIHFNAVQFKVASHAEEWWVAAVDRETGWTYVKVFDPQQDARYVDDNGPIEVYGSHMDSPRDEPFVELELLTGIERCRPGRGITQREHWYATICRGPILSFSPAGVVCERLAFERDETQGRLSGRFGVFHLGSVRADAFGKDNRPLASSEPVPIDPREELVLDLAVPLRAGTEEVVLKVFDHNGDYVGELGRAKVSPGAS